MPNPDTRHLPLSARLRIKMTALALFGLYSLIILAGAFCSYIFWREMALGAAVVIIALSLLGLVWWIVDRRAISSRSV